MTTFPFCVSVDWQSTVGAFLHDIQRQAAEMIPYEQTGLQKIRRFTSSADAVAFKNLFVVQSVEDTEFEPNGLGLEPVATELGSFDSYALVLECTANQGTVKIQARHDIAIISAEQMTTML
jgi:hypothetical protein